MIFYTHFLLLTSLFLNYYNIFHLSMIVIEFHFLSLAKKIFLCYFIKDVFYLLISVFSA